MKVFISSTYRDLIDHRAAAVDAVQRLGLHAVGMEHFGARPDEPKRACLAEIAESDLFVGIYGSRYGYIPPDSKVSITEAEFDHAHSIHRPTFCFVSAPDYTWADVAPEDAAALEQLARLKTRLNTLVVTETFTSPAVLANRVATSLARYLIADPRRHRAPAVSNYARNSISDLAMMTFVDVMRLTGVAASESARTANAERYREFVDMADQHLSELRAQATRLSPHTTELLDPCAKVEAGLAFAITRLRREPKLDRPWSQFARLLCPIAENVSALAMSATPEYMLARQGESTPPIERVLRKATPAQASDPDVFWRYRMAAQNEVVYALRVTAALAIAGIRDDVDRILAFPYFAIDHRLLKLATAG